MEESSEFFGWLTVFFFFLVVIGGLLLRFGKLREYRKTIAQLHKVTSFLAIGTLSLHFLLISKRPLALILAGLGIIMIPILTIALKRSKKQRQAITIKLVLIPVLAFVLVSGHHETDGSDSDRRPHQGESLFDHWDD
jgi:hypothetical protein